MLHVVGAEGGEWEFIPPQPTKGSGELHSWANEFGPFLAFFDQYLARYLGNDTS